MFDFTWSLTCIFQCLFIFESHFFKFLVSDLKEEQCLQMKPSTAPYFN